MSGVTVWCTSACTTIINRFGAAAAGTAIAWKISDASNASSESAGIELDARTVLVAAAAAAAAASVLFAVHVEQRKRSCVCWYWQHVLPSNDGSRGQQPAVALQGCVCSWHPHAMRVALKHCRLPSKSFPALKGAHTTDCPGIAYMLLVH
jgi:hypothetical protein